MHHISCKLATVFDCIVSVKIINIIWYKNKIKLMYGMIAVTSSRSHFYLGFLLKPKCGVEWWQHTFHCTHAAVTQQAACHESGTARVEFVSIACCTGIKKLFIWRKMNMSEASNGIWIWAPFFSKLASNRLDMLNVITGRGRKNVHT